MNILSLSSINSNDLSPIQYGSLISEANDDDLVERKRTLKVLVVDDDDVDRERISRYLYKLNLSISLVLASSGVKAIELVRNETFDILLLDYRLGDMTGTELLSKLEQIQRNVIPTIMITGMGDERTAITAMKLGVHDYLPKNGLTPEMLMSSIGSALHAADLEQKLREAQSNLKILSLYDSLTGLPNRNLFFDRLNQSINTAARHNGHFKVLMIDLNLFKEVNDSHGHRIGDELLAKIGDRLRYIARRSDTFARIGGDEFAAILYDIQSDEDAITCVEKISAVISKPLAIGDQILQVGSAIGIASYPVHGLDQTTLISNADYAMYSAKRNGRRYEIYAHADEVTPESKIPVSLYLHRAIKDNELFLEYQPKINLRTNEILGVEALVRWNSPEFGIVPPASFIPIAERSNLIEKLTYKIIDMALKQFALWRDQGHTIPIALNISARTLDNRNFLTWMLSMIRKYDIDAENITLEITETTFASSSRAACQLLTELNDEGFDISIDDFGSGFTSFASIRNVSISELKIDRMYVENLQSGGKDSAIVLTMLSLADSLGMRAIAEGVETTDQWDELQKLGCSFAQGYGIARPMVGDAVINWVESICQSEFCH